MKLNFRIIKKKIEPEFLPEDFDPLFDDDSYEIINMKCLHCNYEEDLDADIVLECFNPHREDFPCFICPHCNHGDLVPKDVYD